MALPTSSVAGGHGAKGFALRPRTPGVRGCSVRQLPHHHPDAANDREENSAGKLQTLARTAIMTRLITVHGSKFLISAGFPYRVG
jgi:hypothetical protein